MDELDRLLDILLTGDAEDPACDRALKRLKTYGPEVVEPCFAALAAVEPWDTMRRIDFVDVLVATKVRDDRIFAHVLDLVEREPTVGVDLVAEYGDPDALPILRDTLATIEPGDPHKQRDEWILGFCDAIETLGGELTFEERDRMSAAATTIFGGLKVGRTVDPEAQAIVAKLKELVAIEQRPPAPDARCWCRSGKMYKNCHQRTDAESERPRPRESKSVH